MHRSAATLVRLHVDGFLRARFRIDVDDFAFLEQHKVGSLPENGRGIQQNGLGQLADVEVIQKKARQLDDFQPQAIVFLSRAT